LSEFNETILCAKCKKFMEIDPVAQHGKTKQTPSNWPMESDAAGVHPAQAKEYSDYLRDKGVPTEVRPNGNPVFTSQHHRAEVCKATGMYDRNAGYGDRAPANNMKKRKQRLRHG
jgi:hypothetical protein